MHDTTDATTSLWTRARAMFARALAVIGLHQGFPDAARAWIAHVAALAQLSPERRAEIVSWLAPLEHIVRKLLLSEAAALHRAERARPAPRVERVPLRGLAQTWRGGRLCPAPAVAEKRDLSAEALAEGSNVDRSRPETWRAQFSLAIPRDPKRVADAHAPRIRALWGEATPAPEPARTPRAFNEADSPFRLARRFEALCRVLENQRAYAERLARALTRETARRSGIARAYLFAPCRANGHDPADPRLAVDAISQAFEAEQAFESG
jgi:hypothetical protein